MRSDARRMLTRTNRTRAMRGLQGESGREYRAAAVLAFARLDFAAVQFDEFADERQPDAEAARGACRR